MHLEVHPNLTRNVNVNTNRMQFVITAFASPASNLSFPTKLSNHPQRSMANQTRPPSIHCVQMVRCRIEL